ncbi:MAG TPA: DinB family protein, partial [Bryobacteraceae bacterium]|nr:DinB family protein [Bryobacteraceae bacterium]
MKRNSIVILAAALAGGGAIQAQKADPLSGEIRQMYDRVKNNLTKTAEKMPQENYSFKPTAETRTFGQIIAHVADVQARTCSEINGEPKALNAGSK